MARYVRSIFLSSFSVIPNVCASTTILKIADIFAHTPSQTPAPQSSNLAVGVALRELKFNLKEYIKSDPLSDFVENSGSTKNLIVMMVGMLLKVSRLLLMWKPNSSVLSALGN